MSLIIERSKAGDANEEFEIYGIKTRFDSHGDVYLILPTCLTEKKEARKLYDDLSKLGNKLILKDLKVGRGGIGVVFGDKGFFSKNKRTAYMTIAGNQKDILELGTYSENGSSFSDSEALIGAVLRKTIIGQRLKEYWVEKEKISEWDASGRLFRITPKADALSANIISASS